jgi:hypothetical protein
VADDYGRVEWQKDEAAARAEALRRIAIAQDTRADTLDLTDLTALTALPTEIGALTELRRLFAGDRRPDGSQTPFTWFRLADIAALSSLSALVTLDLSLTQITDAGPLSALTGLTSLNLSGTQIADFGPLSALTGLTLLNLSVTRIADFGPLSALTGLTSLNLSYTGITDAGPLSGLTGLTSLDLSRTRIADAGPLSGLTGLTWLGLGNTGIADAGPLSGLTGLTSLDLSYTQIADLSFLLQIPAFAQERAESLDFSNTPAANPERDRRLYMLSRLDEQRCAVETAQYLNGTHPDFRDPPAGSVVLPLAQRLAQASPLGLVVEDGWVEAANPGTPERLAPKELSLRLQALRTHIAALQADAATQQVPRSLINKFEAYAMPLGSEDPTHILLDGPMSFLRGAVTDSYVRELDAGFVAGWRQLVAMHDDLRPLLMPDEEDMPDLPDPVPEATPEAGLEVVDAALEVLEEGRQAGAVGDSVIAAMTAMRDYFEAAKGDVARRPGLIKRGLRAVGGTLALLANTTNLTAAAVTLQLWASTPQGQAVILQLQPILARILALFGG